MLSENIRNYRKAKGLSQEELAAKLNVVRQTVSKWEKGLSVPDSEMLILLAEVFAVPVAELLGETVSQEDAPTLQSLAAKLELLNEQFAKKAERSRKVWRTVFLVIGCISVAVLLFELVSLLNYYFHINIPTMEDDTIAIIGGADGPTAIFVSSTVSWLEMLILLSVGIAVLVAAIFIFRRIKKH